MTELFMIIGIMMMFFSLMIISNTKGRSNIFDRRFRDMVSADKPKRPKPTDCFTRKMNPIQTQKFIPFGSTQSFEESKINIIDKNKEEE